MCLLFHFVISIQLENVMFAFRIKLCGKLLIFRFMHSNL